MTVEVDQPIVKMGARVRESCDVIECDRVNNNGMEGLVRLTDQAIVDAHWVHDWADLADPLPDHPCDVLLCLRAGDPQEGAVEGGLAVRHQPRGEPDLHTDSVRDARPTVGGGGHPDRLGHDHLDYGCDLEALSLGGRRSGSVLRLGLDCDRPATVYHLVELVDMLNSPSYTATESPLSVMPYKLSLHVRCVCLTCRICIWAAVPGQQALPAVHLRLIERTGV